MTDNEAFRRAMSDVSPLQRKAKVNRRDPNRHQKDSILARRSAAETDLEKIIPNLLTQGDVPQLRPDSFLEWRKDGVQLGVFRRLKGGRYVINGSLDLHGKTVKEASKMVQDFFEFASTQGWRTVLVIHGRGEKSVKPARLKSYVAIWLKECPNVIAYSSAKKNHGGTGAVYVLLKKSEKDKQNNREFFGNQGSFPNQD